MNKKKIKVIIASLIILAAIFLGILYFLNIKDDNTNLSVLDKKWLSDHKDVVNNIAIEDNVPLFNYNGKGIVLDFINDFEEKTGFEFNDKVLNDDDDSEYKFKLVKENYELSSTDILIYTDSYVVLSNKNEKIESHLEFESKEFGILKSDLDCAKHYLNDTLNVTFSSYDSYDLVFKALKDEEIDYIIVPYNYNMERIITSKKNILYHMGDMNLKYILSFKGDKKLNEILKKYYEIWSKNNFEKKFNDRYYNMYIKLNDIPDKDIAVYKSKRYKYGFVNNLPYDFYLNGKLVGSNSKYLKEVSKFGKIDFEFVRFNSIKELKKALSEGSIDIAFNYYDASNIKADLLNSNSIYYEELVILSKKSNFKPIKSFNSLCDSKVGTIKDSDISNYLKNNDVNVVVFDSLRKMSQNLSKYEYYAVDFKTYEYYKNSLFSNFRLALKMEVNEEYNFSILKTKENEVFYKLFNFYISGIDNLYFNNSAVYSLSPSIKNSIFNSYIVKYGIITLLILVALFIAFKRILIIRKNKKEITKDNKLKYIDMLTSLKNRNYLNSNVSIWNENDVYPQAVIIVDLHSISLINDNHGHKEGDRVIVDAAGVLIKNQLENSDIMRTNGNEFMVYLIGYDEKKISSYVKLLNRELKKIKYNYGASIGYHMILDDVTTIDDAINEATIDMKKQKESM